MTDYSRKSDAQLRNDIRILTNQYVAAYKLPELRKAIAIQLKDNSTEYIQRYN